MFLALALPLFVLPLLVGFSRFEQRIMSGVGGATGSPGAVRVSAPAASDAA